MKRFEGIHIKEVGVFKDVQIEFPEKRLKDKAEIHIFTGLNGSGKTTLLECLIGLFQGNENVSQKYSSTSRVSIQFNDSIYKSIYQDNIRSFYYKDEDDYSDGDYKIKPITQLNHNQKGISTHNLTYIRLDQVKLDYSAFAYSGKRTVNDSSNHEEISNKNPNPLHQALEFNKNKTSDLLLLQWVKDAITKKALAAYNGDSEKAEKYGKIIQTIEQIISDITNSQIKFKLLDNPLKVIIEENGQEVDFETLSDGLKSLISWIADLLLRLERTPWEGDVPVLERNFILFLDEIEIHLHPSLQRKVLPIVQRLFPNAQIFVSTHSPFVVGSVSDAWVYKLELNDGVTTISNPIPSKAGYSFHNILDEIFNVEEEFDVETEQLLDEFYNLKARLLKGLTIDEAELDKLVKELSQKSVEVKDIVAGEMQQLKRVQQKR